MSEPVSRESAEHYVWGGVCDGWRLVRTPELSVIEERMPAGSEEQRHLHARARQFFYVLSGELAMELDGARYRLGPGQGIEIDPGKPHRAQNLTLAEVRFLVISQPASHGDRIAREEAP